MVDNGSTDGSVAMVRTDHPNVRLVESERNLGFGGAVTFERALQIRRLASHLPLSALVLETDSPDIPPHWVYRTAQQRAEGEPQGRNEPAQLPRIAQVVAQLRGISPEELAEATARNAVEALPKLAPLIQAGALADHNRAQ